MEKPLPEETSLAFLKKGKIGYSPLPPEDYGRSFKEFKETHKTNNLVRDFIREQEERSHVNKYERERMRDLLIETRQLLISGKIDETTANNVRQEVKNTTLALDKMNRNLPLYNPDKSELPAGVEVVEIESPELGKMAIKVTRIQGIRGESENNEELIPTIVSTGWSADFKSTIALQESLALEGVDSIGIAMPEHYTSVVSDDWSKRLQRTGDYSLHAKSLIEICKKLGVRKIDLTGYSAGGSVSLSVAHELAMHPSKDIEVRHLDAFNPTGFVDTTPIQLAANFLKAGIQAQSLPDVGRRSMMVQRIRLGDWTSRGMFTMVKDILPKKVFSSEYLAAIRTGGRCNIFASDTDPVSKESVIRPEVNKAREYPNSQISIITIKNGNHGMLVQGAAGFAHSFAENTPIKDGTDIKKIPATQADLIAKKYQIVF